MKSIVFLGHVDCGKSTLIGQILVSTGFISAREVEKLSAEAKSKNMATWYLSYAVDTLDSERERGKTSDFCRVFFSFNGNDYTLIDVPGHRNYVQHMISGVSQADIAILVVSAKTGEFESGFEGGQTKEHIVLARTVGVKNLIVAINKCEGQSSKRINQITNDMKSYLAEFGYTSPPFICISAYKGLNITKPLFPDKPCLFNLIDSFPDSVQDPNANMCARVIYSSDGNVVARVESGKPISGETLSVLPTSSQVVFTGNTEGDTIIIPSEEKFFPGDMIYRGTPSREVSKTFIGTMTSMSPEVISGGYSGILHSGLASCECNIVKVQNMSKLPFLRQGESGKVKITLSREMVLTDTFILRNGGMTVGIGKVGV